MNRMLVPLLALALLSPTVASRPLLITVELPDRELQTSWHDLGFATYEFIGTTAIAEVDQGALRELAARGFPCQVIDRDVWGGEYLLVDRRCCTSIPSTARVLWERGDVQVLKVPVEHLGETWRICEDSRPLRRRAFPERFWRELLTTRVPLKSIPWNPEIQALVDEVNSDSLAAYIQRLVDLKTRFALTESSYAASQWLLNRFTTWGYAAEFDSFPKQVLGYSGIERSVVATKPGTTSSPEYCIVGGHFDSIVDYPADPTVFAPGADDNATGAASVLEIARVLRTATLDRPVELVTWGGEEMGLTGSTHYAEEAVALDFPLWGVLNLDMIGYMDDASLDCLMKYNTPISSWLADLWTEAAQTYVSGLLMYADPGSIGGSDWASFSFLGYPAVGAAEHPGTLFNPNMHTPADTMGTLTAELYTAITKATLATVVTLQIFPGTVMDVAAQDVGDGQSLLVTWSPNSEPDVIGYTVWWGPESDVYTDSLFLPGAASDSCLLGGLPTGVPHYVTVRAGDTDGYQSAMATEVVGVPRLVPLAPTGLVATPIAGGIELDWQPNGEVDVSGYRLYRRLNDATEYDSLNVALLVEPTYVDQPLSGSNRYYYAAKAFDESGNASGLSAEAYGRPITLDQGILVVDETRNSTNPPDSLQDAFYRFLLGGYRYTEWEYSTGAGVPVVADLVPYSTVLWHADDFSQLLAAGCVSALETYLDAGGSLWLEGWKPAGNLEGSALIYPADFGVGDFIHDYFRVAHVDISGSEDAVQGVEGQEGYPDLAVDPDKVPFPAWGGTLRYVEGSTPAQEAQPIYVIDLTNDTSPFEGQACGVRYLGEDFKTVYCGFPLYFMEQDQARLLAQRVMADFGELGGEWPGADPAALRLQLSQNAPNPFGRETTIRYWLPEASDVRLSVYDMAGHVVRVLIDGREAGGPQRVVWDGLDTSGAPVGSGTYVCMLRTGEGKMARRVLVLR